MIFVQIVLGGITRLTGSGLSITKWEIVTGTIPPLSQADWEHEFELYKETPQYQQINQGMVLSRFKFIYFWEYVHRLWARSIGFVFLIPFIVFMIRGGIDRRLLQDLGIAVLLGAVVATFGWIMVASGLVKRPWVNAYNLTVHLNLALILYTWMFWIALGKDRERLRSISLKRGLNWLSVFVIFQLILGGMMSGMKAAVYYPTWPDMYGAFFPTELLKSDLWTGRYLFDEYESGPVPGIVQFLHRTIAYIIVLITAILVYKSSSYKINKKVWNGFVTLGIIVGVQVLLGILTVINSIGKIPFEYGVLHQAMAVMLLSNVIYLHWKIRR
jgi:cytochrome c oxidase assembly protein subunit 15